MKLRDILFPFKSKELVPPRKDRKRYNELVDIGRGKDDKWSPRTVTRNDEIWMKRLIAKHPDVKLNNRGKFDL